MELRLRLRGGWCAGGGPEPRLVLDELQSRGLVCASSWTPGRGPSHAGASGCSPSKWAAAAVCIKALLRG